MTALAKVRTALRARRKSRNRLVRLGVRSLSATYRLVLAVAARGTTNLRRIYPFEKFDRQLRELDAHVKSGGILVVHNAQYLVADASVISHYEPLAIAGQEVDRLPKFDRRSRQTEAPPPGSSIYVKAGP